MVHQIAEKLTVTAIQDSSPKKYSAFEGGVQGLGGSEATSKLNYDNDTSNSGQAGTWENLFKGNNLRPTSKARTLYVQIRDEVAYQIIKHGLSRAESKLFFYFLLLDRFGDRPVKVKVAEILLDTGVSKSVYHVTIAKFQKRGWFGFTNADIEIRNFCTPTKKSEKQDYQSEKQDYQSEKQDSQSEKQDSQSTKQDSEKLKPLPAQVSKTPQTLQTYSDLLHTLSEDQRESFKKFCLKKIQECSFKIGSKEAWLNKHGAEYLEEFKETYSYALANPEVIPPKALPFEIPDIAYLKQFYGDGWKDAAIHYGLIDPNSPEEEIQDESEPVTAPEVTEKPISDSGNPQAPTPKPITDSDNPQEATSPTPAITSNHEQFAEGDRVVVAEVGNSHYGKTGKIIAARSRSQDDKYIIALDRKSPSARELTIKIPKECKLTYLTKL
jgi:Skp family chaperone for outer membrane proteins